MTKKKRGHPDVEEILARPWCYYCERDFDDLKILISHQKAKHFKCERCGRRLNTAGGLSVHMNQVHKETLTSVDNALGNRASLDVEIFGMEGIPEDVVQAHNQRIVAQFYQAEAERRAATGNPGPGGGGQGGTKKPKFESPSDLKKRLAEHKARMAEQAAGGGSSGGSTPVQNNGQSPATVQSPAVLNGSPYPPPQVPFAGSFSQEPYVQPNPAYQPPYNQAPAFSPPPPGAQFPPQQFPQQQYPAPGFQQPPTFPGAPPQQFGAGSLPGAFNPYQQPPSHTPPQLGSLPARPPSLPPAPGLPQRPSFGTGAPPPMPMQQGPPGQQNWAGNGWGGDHQNPAMSSAYPPQSYNSNASTVDDLISSASKPQDDIDAIIRMAEAGIKPPKKVEAAAATAPDPAPAPAPLEMPTPTPAAVVEVTAVPEVSEKKSKKEKDKAMKMVYSDNDVSPEEKMARLPRYAFHPDRKEETTLAEAAEPAVTGPVDAQI